ncbi:MAG: ribosome maturation factor RimP [Clostridiales bacterium]|nr:ribosome maturation factor RimP [Clostridiales bacterium]
MQAKDVEKRVRDLTEPFVKDTDIHIWDVEFCKEGGVYQLTIYIDKEGGISIDDCENLSRKIDPLLDGREFNDLPSYTFCVSSAGLDRKLTKPEHFIQCIGQDVELKFYKAMDGMKSVVGRLIEATDDDVKINVDGEEKSYKKEMLATVRLYIEI